MSEIPCPYLSYSTFYPHDIDFKKAIPHTLHWTIQTILPTANPFDFVQKASGVIINYSFWKCSLKVTNSSKDANYWKAHYWNKIYGKCDGVPISKL